MSVNKRPKIVEVSKEGYYDGGKIAAGGLIAVCLIILQNIFPSTSLDIPELISLISISTSVPLLAGFIIYVNVFIRDGFYIDSFSYKLLISTFYIGMFAAFMGIDAAIWHILWMAGLVFFLISVTSLAIYLVYFIVNHEKPLEERRKNPQTKA